MRWFVRHPKIIWVLIFAFSALVGSVSAAEPGTTGEQAKESENSGGGILGSVLGGTIRRGLGLSSGDFAEFTLNRIRIVNAKMAAPEISKEPKANTTFLQVDEILIEYSPLDVMRKKILKRVVIERPQVWVSQLTRKLEDPDNIKKPEIKSQSTKPAEGGSIKLIIQRLEMKDVEVYIDTLRTQGLNIPLRFAQKDPIVFEQLSIDELLNHPGAEKQVTVDADQVMLHSAYGPMAPLISVGKLQVGFTWKGLFNKELESVEFDDPALYIGDDWFMMLNEFKKTTTIANIPPAEAEKKIAEENFMVKKFRIRRLKLSLSSFGVLKLELPFSFNYDANDVGLDQNGRFFLNSKLKINETDFEMPAYNLSVQGLEGDLKFNWPPAAGTQDNIVPTLKAMALKLKDIQITNPWASLTFLTDTNKEPAGISEKQASKAYLGFGTECYGGYLNGYVESDFDRNWEAEFTGKDINIQAINAFRSQPLQGVFQLRIDAHGVAGAVHDCVVNLVNARGIPLVLNFTGKINEFFEDVTEEKPQPNPDDDMRALMGKLSREQRVRSGEIQTLKNARLVGESKLGFLEVRGKGMEASYPGATKLVQDENDGRKQIYQFIMTRDKKTLDQVEQEYADLWQERSFPGEWIESPSRGWTEK